MAAALKADRCEIIKEVDGICSADPRIVPNAKPLRRVDFGSLSEMCFWGANILHFRSVELANSQGVPLVLKQWGGVKRSTLVMKEVAGMENGKVLAVNSLARIEHVEIDSNDLNHGFEKFAEHLKQNSLSQPQLLASSFAVGRTCMTMACDSEWLDALLRTLKRSKDLRQQREASSSVSLTCFGGVSSELPFMALQVLGHYGILPEMYVLSPHSVTVFLSVEDREAAVKALHSLVQPAAD
jgi:aspartate kinase